MMSYQDHASTHPALGSEQIRHVPADPSSHTIASVQPQNHLMPVVTSLEDRSSAAHTPHHLDELSTASAPDVTSTEMSAGASGDDPEGQDVSAVAGGVSAASVKAMWDRARLISTAAEPQNQQMFHQWLRELHSYCAYDLATLTQITKISPAYLEALFTGQLSIIPHESLVRGLVQCLAQLLSAHPDPIMFAYRACYQREFAEPGLMSSFHATGLLLQPLSKVAAAKLHGRVALQWLGASVLRHPWRSAALLVAILSVSWLLYLQVVRSADHNGASLSKTYGFLSYPLASSPELYARADPAAWLSGTAAYNETAHNVLKTTSMADSILDKPLRVESGETGFDGDADDDLAIPEVLVSVERTSNQTAGALAASAATSSVERDPLVSYSPTPAIIKTQLKSLILAASPPASPLVQAWSVEVNFQASISQRRNRNNGLLLSGPLIPADLTALARSSAWLRSPLSQPSPVVAAAVSMRSGAVSRQLSRAFQQASLLVTDHHASQEEQLGSTRALP